ncbi:MAG: urocanate hydratase [Lachnospiraceae bacterium]|jgi:urocanate hydratase|nr:urocanate hydratase [Lachnospiraceae bacterium]
MEIELDYALPKYPDFVPGIRRAPKREATLSKADKILAIKNALRYIHPDHHEQMAREFAEELEEHGRIYGYRFRPEGAIKGLPIESYKGACIEGKAFQVMIDNNLDFDVALYPYELVTYGETGQVCQNWMQYRMIKKYLEVLTEKQTLVMMSGHPLGLFRSHSLAPRVITTNALMVGAFDNNEDFKRAAALGVANYGQMTAGGWMYIGPQGIVHGTFNTLLNAGRLKLNIPNDKDLAGKLFVSAGLGGMSGAQGKAAVIAGAVAIVAEVDESRIKTRLQQGWVCAVCETLPEAVELAKKKICEKEPFAIAYHGNVVDLLEYLIENKVKVDLLSDQTSCHAPYDGGYCPAGISFEERTNLLATDKERFAKLVDTSLLRHYNCIRKLSQAGTYFFDYGNSFLKAVYDVVKKEDGREGIFLSDLCKNKENDRDGFTYPSYVEDILGPQLFDYGYGPFRWCVLSGKPEDLKKTDMAAAACIDENRRYQDRDNKEWVLAAEKNKLVVGTQCRILYQDALGRMNIALKFNEMVRNKEIGPVMLGRDHHDTGGTDSPFRETSNIKDGSNIMADMATQCFAGNAARGMSLVALHNGGGVGIGKSINGGFGLVLDGSERVDTILRMAMPWDVMVGVARRSWARNENAVETVKSYNEQFADTDHITLPYIADDDLLSDMED